MKIIVLGKEKKIIIQNLPHVSALQWSISAFSETNILKAGFFEIDQKNHAIDCSDLKSWSPDSANLYVIEICKESECLLEQTFGLMDLSCSQDQLYINGEPLYVRGYTRGLKGHEHDNFSFVNPSDFYEKNIRAAKDYGFNLSRWHSTIPDEDFLNMADKLGLLCQVEFKFKPIWGKDENGGNVLERVEVDEDEVGKTIKRLSKHPSVAIYCVGNEIHNSGQRPEVGRVVDIIRSLDPYKLIMDNCGWGEFDRTSSDLFSQHIGYYFPYGVHYDMFNVWDVFRLDGSINGPVKFDGEGCFADEINVARPVLAHEVLHYISWPDTDKLRKDFADPIINANKLPEPWWVEAVMALEKTKGINRERKNQFIKASEYFKKICTKHAVEQIRKSPILQGYEMLQLADTNYYENPNGLLDCFDNHKSFKAQEYKNVNDNVVLLTDLPQRCFAAESEIEIPFLISNFANKSEFANGDLSVELKSENKILQKFVSANLKLQRRGLYKLGIWKIKFCGINKPLKITIEAKLTVDNDDSYSNSWDIWVFPKVKPSFEGVEIAYSLDEKLLNKVSDGASVLLLYNPLKNKNEGAQYNFAYVRDHFKPVIWDRGHQLGAIIRYNDAIKDFPHDSVLDFQFAKLVEEAVKINLDGFPVEINPIIEGIDRPVRDRMLVITGKITDFDPHYYMRKFGYLFELIIGKGRLLVCTFNFTNGDVESDYLMSSLISYLKKKPQNAFEISLDAFVDFLKKSPENGRIPEPPMNEYWERDSEPVETKLFWEEVGVDITKL